MKCSRYWWGVTASIALGLLILDSRTALEGGREGIRLCIQSLIPSLFPFFVLSGLMTNVWIGSPLPFLRPAGKLLGVPQGCESILIPAFLGGYPAGAQCIGQAFAQGQLSAASARRMFLFCNNAGPAFLFGVLGPVFPSQEMLWALWGIQTAASLLCAWILPGSRESGSILPAKKISLTGCLTDAVGIMGSVCGWVILFRILISFLDRWFLWMLPLPSRVAVTGLLELSNGCCALADVADIRLRFLLCSGMLSFGGLCVTMQTASVAGGLSIGSYLCSKLLQSLFCVSVSAGFLFRKPVLWLVTAVFFWVIKKVVTSRYTMVYNKHINQRRKPYAVS